MHVAYYHLPSVCAWQRRYSNLTMPVYKPLSSGPHVVDVTKEPHDSQHKRAPNNIKSVLGTTNVTKFSSQKRAHTEFLCDAQARPYTDTSTMSSDFHCMPVMNRHAAFVG